MKIKSHSLCRGVILLGASLALMALPVQAVPTLQLDVENGVYDLATETIVSTSNPFNLYALISGGIQAGATYYISAAIVPQTANPPTESFGSFSVGGVVYNVGNMVFGTPPVDDPDFNPLNIGGHGIYDTHFAEIAFTPNASMTALEYNSQDNPGGLTPDAAGTLIYQDFLVDVSGLAAGYHVHFDLYTVAEIRQGQKTGTSITDFAPFSHDAQSNGGNVPEGGMTLAMLGVGLCALGSLRRFVKN